MLPLLLSLGGCPCGFDCGSDDEVLPARLTLGFSDESIEDIRQVVIEVDSITLRGTGLEDVVVDSFTIPSLGLTDSDTVTLNLLDYRGRNQLTMIDALELPRGNYRELIVDIVGGDVNRSFVEESDGTVRRLDTASAGLNVPGATLVSGAQFYTLEFGLAMALQASGADYILTEDGVRLENSDEAASLTGRVSELLFDRDSPCDEKNDPTAGNRLYLYAGTALELDTLVDVYNSRNTNPTPDTALAPFAVGNLLQNDLTGNWEYAFGYVPAGDYTLAFSCAAAGDDPVQYDGLVIPFPVDQRYEVELSAGVQSVCDLKPGAGCS